MLNADTLPTTPYPDICKRFAEKGVVQDLTAYDPVVIFRSLEESASNTIVAIEGEDQLLKASNSQGVEAFGFRAPCMSVDLKALSFYGEFCKSATRCSLITSSARLRPTLSMNLPSARRMRVGLFSHQPHAPRPLPGTFCWLSQMP